MICLRRSMNPCTTMYKTSERYLGSRHLHGAHNAIASYHFHDAVLISIHKTSNNSLKPLHTAWSILLPSELPQAHPPSIAVLHHSPVDHLGLVHRVELVLREESCEFGEPETNCLFLLAITVYLESRFAAYSSEHLDRCGLACRYLDDRSL